MDGDESILAAFLAESRENLDEFDQDLIALQSGDQVAERTARLFRTLHTVKGTCGFLDLPRLGALAHAGETVLGELRDQRLRPVPAVVRALLALGDRIRLVLDQVGTGGADDPIGAEDRACLDALRRAVADGMDGADGVDGVDGTTRQAGAPHWDRRRGAPDSSLRVDVALLDRLLNLVGELVVVRNQFRSHQAGQQVQPEVGQLERITAELHDAVARTRLQPIATLSTHLPRLVHDVSAELGRDVSLVVEGEDTLLDKTVLDAMRDPLTHLVRNAVDHGIEPPAVRAAAGKQARGLVRLRAFSEGGQVVVEVTDDGAGIDLGLLLNRAVELGVVTADEAARLDETEVCDLLFHPGLSTRTEATSISGRGVGADIVRANVARVGGSVTVSTSAGAGTTFRIRIPVTLAIIGALLVVAGGTTYAVPQSHVVEVVRVVDASIAPTPSGPPVLRLRGRLLPLLGVADPAAPAGPGEPGGFAVVVTVDGRHVALLVDAVRDTIEIVVKPLGTMLGRLPAYAGAPLLGAGTAALILDVAGLARTRGLREPRSDEPTDTLPVPDVAARFDSTASYVLLRAPDGGSMAVPLTRVIRLSELDGADLEPHGALDAVRYDGDVLPLADVSVLLPERRAKRRTTPESVVDGSRIPVVVCRTEHGPLGLVVGAIADVVHAPVAPARPASRDGVAETVLIGDRVTEVLDVDRLATLAGRTRAAGELIGAER